MARFARRVTRTSEPRSAAMWAVLLTVLAILLGSYAPGSEHARAVSGAGVTGETAPARSASYADSVSYVASADPAILTTLSVRSDRAGTGERHASPVATPGTARAASATPFPCAPPPSATSPPASGQPAHRDGVRAPPTLSGI
ncbi:hypothetical protein [Streptomyces sp. NPDC057280]|uniref:hypothetical protein n=1 Tax=Streptomyces sp. NPDC057280 TaxID=3346081 RepID=UPI0036393BEF